MPPSQPKNNTQQTNYFLQEKAASEFAKIVSEVSETYFKHMRQMAESTTPSAAQLQAQQLAIETSYAQTLGAAAFGLGGLGVGALTGNPVLGGVLGGMAGSVYSGFVGAQSAVDLVRLQMLATGQQAASYGAFASSGAYGNPAALLAAFQAQSGNQGIANSQLGVFNQFAQNPYIGVSPGDVAALWNQSRSSLMPFGDSSIVQAQLSGAARIASYYPGSFGMGVMDVAARYLTPRVETPSYSEIYSRLQREGASFSPADRLRAAQDAMRATGAELSEETLRNLTRTDSDSDPFGVAEAINSDRPGFTRRFVRTLQNLVPKKHITEIGDTTYASDLARVMGAEGYSSLRQRGMTAEAEQAARAGLNAGAVDTYRGQRLSALADAAMLSGDYGSASRLMRQAASTLSGRMEAARRLGGEQFDALAEQLNAEQRRQMGLAASFDYRTAGIPLVDGYAAGQTGMTRWNLYGDTDALRSGTAANLSAMDRDAQRTMRRLNQGNFSDPSEEEGLRKRLLDIIREESTERSRMVRELADAGVRIASAGMVSAGANQRTGLLLGLGGSDAAGLAEGTYRAAYGRYQSTEQRVSAIVGDMRRAGMSDAQIQQSPVYQDAVAQSRAAYSDAANAYVQQGQIPNSVGLRRQYAQDSTNLQISNLLPGGNSYGNTRRLLRDLEQMQREDDASLSKLRQDGMLSGESGQALLEQFDHRRQERTLQYASAMSDLSFNWQGRLMSEVIGAPSNFGYVSPRMAMRSLVGASRELLNPAFGSK